MSNDEHRKLVADAWYREDEDAEKPRMQFYDGGQDKASGLLAKKIWKEI